MTKKVWHIYVWSYSPLDLFNMTSNPKNGFIVIHLGFHSISSFACLGKENINGKFKVFFLKIGSINIQHLIVADFEKLKFMLEKYDYS